MNNSPQRTPPKHRRPTEPIYILRGPVSSPQARQANGPQRNVSMPASGFEPFPQISQRAFSDSPAGPGISNNEPRSVAGNTRRASSNDVRLGAAAETFTDTGIVASPDYNHTPGASRDSGTFSPRGRAGDDARVLDLTESAPAPVVTNLVQPELQSWQPQSYAYVYSDSGRRSSKYEKLHRQVYVGNLPWSLFEDHTLQRLLCQCGPIECITYLADKGHCFVT